MIAPLRRGIAAALAAGLCAIALAGCSTDSASGGGELSLADSKGASQLVRNLASEDVPADQVSGAPSLEDVTVPCASEKSDPDGLMRWWRSSAIFSVKAETDGAVTRTALVDGFVERGWTAGDVSAGGVVQLAREGVDSKVTVMLGQNGPRTELVVTVDGPCVETAGAESEEVQRAEGTWVEEAKE